MKKRLISILLTMLMLLPFCTGAVGAAAAGEGVTPLNPQAVKTSCGADSGMDPDAVVTFMVKLTDAPTAARVEEFNSPEARAIEGVIKNTQKSVRRSITELGDGVQIDFSYSMLFNGFAVTAPYRCKAMLETIPGVEKVFLAPVYSLPETIKEEDTRLSSSVGYIGVDDAWSAGYTGEGMTVAIIDTGIKQSHAAFATAPSNPSMTTSTISAVLADNTLQAESLYSGTLTASNLYYSAKLPFNFNYGSGNLDVSHSDAGSDHGTHVAGIVGGYSSSSSYVGVAKDAQLIVMQVFGSEGAAWSTILAALEDCAYLEVDAINMSLGSDCGFTSDGEEIDAVYDLLHERGVDVACAVGNSASYYGSEHSYAFTMNMDNGVISSPSTYSGSLAVASSTKASSPGISDFSSWGTTADLKLKPEVTAPGSSIYSATDTSYSYSNWGSKSGTSMATPHVAGAMALVGSYVDGAFPDLTAGERVEMINRLLMCTAKPATTSGAPYSPRQQGSGVINVYNAISTDAYITVDGCVRPKLELGDDKDKTGVYEMSFNIVNFGNTSLTYTVTPYVLTESYTSKTVNSQTTYAMAGEPWNITSSCTVSHDGSVTVPANSTVTYTVTVTLSSSLKSQLNTYFPSGAYIEGFIVLDGTVDLSVPYLGFYGNWNYASMIDRYTFVDEIIGNDDWSTINQTIIGSVTSGSSYLLMGANPYIESNDWLADRCTLSPNSDTYYEQIDKFQLALLRNAGECGIRIYNEDDPTIVYYEEVVENMPKSWNYGGISYYLASDWMEFTSWAPDALAEGETAVFHMFAYLDNPDFTPEQNECCEFVLPVTIDTTAPELTYWNLENGTLTARIYDNHYAAWIGVYSNSSCTNLLYEQAITETTRGAITEITASVGSYDTVYVKLGDYGYNTSSVLTVTGEGGDLEPVAIESAELADVDVLVGETAAAKLTVTPSYADYTVEYSVEDTSIATVGTTGVVTGVAAGTTALTATIYDNVAQTTLVRTSTITVTEFEGWVLADELESGGTYIIVANGSGHAVSNNTVTNSRYLDPVAVTVNSDDTLTVDSSVNVAEISWVVEGSSAGWTFCSVDDGKYMGLDSSQYLAPVSTALEWVITSEGYLDNQVDTEEYYYLSYAEASTSIAYDRYTTSKSTTTSTPDVIDFYKYVTTESPEPATYTVTFVDWDGTVLSTQTVEHGGSATPPADPTREGYTFTGWSGSYTNVTSDVTVTAMYTANTYTVTFVDWDGTVLSTQTVEHGGSATPPADPTREGYTFTGWSGSYTNVTSDVTVTAIYYVNSYTLTINYVYEDGTTAANAYTGTYDYGAAYSVTSPFIEGYTPDQATVSGTMGAENVTVTVTYAADTPAQLTGDIDCDGDVDFADVTALQMYLMNMGTLTDEGLANADVNGDGRISFTDASRLYLMLINA